MRDFLVVEMLFPACSLLILRLNVASRLSFSLGSAFRARLFVAIRRVRLFWLV